MNRRLPFIFLLITLFACLNDKAESAVSTVRAKLRAQGTVQDRVREHGAEVKERWAPYFQRASIPYPPDRVILVGLKAEKRLEVYATHGAKTAHIRSFPVKAASGHLGPKLREGDFQVPEGIYPVESLNPNSAFHLSLRVGYPSRDDRAQAALDGRTRLGGDIMIHGSAVSAGCLAMGDEAAEDLFVLAALTGTPNVKVVLSPVDFRKSGLPGSYAKQVQPWLKARYEVIERELAKLPS